MRNPGDILIDDFSKNCEDWAAHGGMAIKHLTGTVEETIEALQEIL